jgi:hypothetical protein
MCFFVHHHHHHISINDMMHDSKSEEDEKPGVKAWHHYSWDFRERVIYQSQALGKSNHEITIDLDMSMWVIQQTLQLWNEIGDVVRVLRANVLKPWQLRTELSGTV